MTSSSQITCPNCGSAQTVPVEKIPPEGAWGRCAVCRHRIFIEHPGTTPTSAGTPPKLSDDTWAPASIDSQPKPPPPPPRQPQPPAVADRKVEALFLKTPGGRTNRHTVREIQSMIRQEQVLPWDLASEDGRKFLPLQTYPDFRENFQGFVATIQKTCWNHPDRVAERICARCQRGYCSDCIPLSRGGSAALSCPACGGVLQETDPGWRLRPYWRRLAEVVSFPRGRSAMTATVGLALVLWLAGLSLVMLPLFLLAALFLVYVLAGSARGRKTLRETLETKPTAEDIREVVERSILTLAILILLALPIVLVNMFLPISIASILTFFLALAAFVYHPMAIAIAVLSEKPLLAFRPQVVLRQIQAMGDDYPALLIGLLIVYAGVSIAQFFIGRIPLVGGLIEALLVAYGALLTAHVLGWTFHLNFGRLNWRRTPLL